MATAGKVAPTPKDKFINGEPYEKLDVVEYNGNLYIAKKASSGVLPTDTEYWMLAISLSGKLDTTGDTENNTVTFESGDETDPTAWKDVNVLASKEKHSSILNKISNMFSNIRYLYKNVGGIKGLSSSSAITTQGEYALDAREKNASVEGTLANQISTLNSNFDKLPYKFGYSCYTYQFFRQADTPYKCCFNGNLGLMIIIQTQISYAIVLANTLYAAKNVFKVAGNMNDDEYSITIEFVQGEVFPYIEISCDAIHTLTLVGNILSYTA